MDQHQLFLDGLEHYVSADDLKACAGTLTDAFCRTKAEAVYAIAGALHDTPKGWERVALARAVLEELHHTELRAWVHDEGRATDSKDESIEVLLGIYFADDVKSERFADEHEPEYDCQLDGAEFSFNVEAAASRPRPYQVEAVAALAEKVRTDVPGKYLVQIATGGGKTRVVNDWLWNHFLTGERRVLWITLSWELLRQAAGDLCRRYPGAAERMGWLGGSGSQRPEVIPDKPSAQIVYSTIHTWQNRSGRALGKQAFDAVVIDEVHWGEGKALYNQLHRRYGASVPFVCMTATPRRWSEGQYERVCLHTFASLVDGGYLARPQLAAVHRTHVIWSPELSSANGDFSKDSLGKLARSQARNALIVRTYLEGRAQFGKTLVFACDIDHASELAGRFQSAGLPADVLHSQMGLEERRSVMSRFRTGVNDQRSRLDILVNVAMLTHGVDIPDIQTVFLTRPTTSDILFSQMVGRGARRIEAEAGIRGKDTFNIVDFVDNLQAHASALQTAESFVGSMTGPTPPPLIQDRPANATANDRNAHIPAEFILHPGSQGYAQLAGLEIQPLQAFQITFPFTGPGFLAGVRPTNWQTIANGLLTALRAAVGSERVSTSPDSNEVVLRDDRWTVGWNPRCGWCVASPRLRSVEGFNEIADGTKAIAVSEHGLKPSRRVGTVLQLHWSGASLDVSHLRRLIDLAASYEPALYSILPVTRFDDEDCLSISREWPALNRLNSPAHWREYLSTPRPGRLGLDATALFSAQGTSMAVRFYPGTWEAEGILTWTSLWMRILFAADRAFDMSIDRTGSAALPLNHTGHGDVVLLAKRLNAGPALSQRLAERRVQVLEGSWLGDEAYGPLARRLITAWKP